MSCAGDGPRPAVLSSPSTPAPAQRSLPRWVWVAVPLLTLVAFGAVIPGYLAMEDFYFVPRYVHLPFADTLRAEWLMKTDINDPQGFLQFYRPLSHMWVHFKVWLFRGWVPALRLDQLALNAAICLALGRVAFRWTEDRTVAALAAVLAVAAPGHMRLLTTVWGSNNLWAALAALVCLDSMYSAVATGRWAWLVATLGATVVGLLSYEQVIVVPFVAIACAFLLGAGGWRACVRPTVAVTLLVSAYFLVRVSLFGGLGGYHNVEGESLIASRSLARLLLQVWNIQWIVALSVVTPFQPPVADLPGAVGWIVLGVWILSMLFTWHRQPRFGRPLCCALLWIVVTSLPVVGLMDAPFHWATYPFFASLGASVILAMIIRAVIPARARGIVAGAIVALYVITTWIGLSMWWDTWRETRTFVAQLRDVVPRDRTPAIAYVRNLPGPRAEPNHFAFLAPRDHDAYTGYLPTRLFLRAAPVKWASGIPYSGSRDWPPPDALQLHWLTWDPATRSLTTDPKAPVPIPGVPLAWDFREVRAAEKWRPAFQLVRALASPPPTYTTGGKYPLLLGPSLPGNLGTPIYADLTMRVQAPAAEPGIAEWHFRTAEMPDTSPAHVIRFWIEQDGAPHTYRVPLVNNPQLLLDGPPTQLDLRPTNTPGALVQILSIKLLPRTAAPDA